MYLCIRYMLKNNWIFLNIFFLVNFFLYESIQSINKSKNEVIYESLFSKVC